jgi:fatty-acyl-CoA synthase
MSADVHRSPLTPTAFLERTAAVFPDRVGVVDGDLRLTWAEVAERARRLAVALQQAGIERGDRVAFLALNAHELLEAHFGVPAAGAVLVAVNSRLMEDEVAYILEHSGSRLLVVDTALEGVGAAAAARAGIASVRVCGPGAPADGERSYEALLAGAGGGPPEPRLGDEDDVISVNYTSGTTGRPKGVMYTHRGAYLNALSEAHHAGLQAGSVYLWTLPMFHCNGWCFPWAVTAAAATHVCLRRMDPPEVWRLLADEQVTHLCGAPTVLVMLAADPAAHRLERPVLATTAAAPPPPTVIARMEALGFRVNHVYGLTETYGPITICDWNPAWDDIDADERARLRARQGVGLLTSDRVRCVDDDMHDVPADGETMGEVVMRGNNVMKGYLDDEAATATAFRGGWFHSGDLGVVHPDGYIELRDRAKDIIISGGENVSSIEVERVLLRHPDVVDVAVVAQPDPVWGERPRAYVAVRDGAEADEAALIAFARTRLPGFKAPAAIEFDDLPRTSTGKVRKNVLRERAREAVTGVEVLGGPS